MQNFRQVSSVHVLELIITNKKSAFTCISAVSTNIQSVVVIAIANGKRSNQKQLQVSINEQVLNNVLLKVS